jgi:hypothetical protein
LKGGFETQTAKQTLLFVNKKKQKNFVLPAVANAGPTPTGIKSFLLLFFKKEVLSSLSIPSPRIVPSVP